MWSLEISPSEHTQDYAHPHAHMLLLVRADVHEGQVINRLKTLASRLGLSGAIALVKGTYRDQEGIADLCGYMIKGHAEATDAAPTSAHAWLRVEAMYRRRSHALFGLLKGSDDEGDEGDEGETETKTDEAETESPKYIKKWLWSAIRSNYVKVRNKSESRDDTLFNEMNAHERAGETEGPEAATDLDPDAVTGLNLDEVTGAADRDLEAATGAAGRDPDAVTGLDPDEVTQVQLIETKTRPQAQLIETKTRPQAST